MKNIIIFITNLLVCIVLNAGITVADDLTKTFNVYPGNSGTENIKIYNEGQEPANITIIQVDYAYNAEGDVFYIDPGKQSRSNANWIKVPRSMIVPPGETIDLPFTYSVPNLSDLNGTYWSVILIEQDTGYTEMENVLGIGWRYEIKILHNISGTGTTDISFLDINFQAEFVGITIFNGGSNLAKTTIKIDIYNSSAVLLGTYYSRETKVFPDHKNREIINYKPLPAGEYYAMIIADCGQNQIFGRQESFVIK